MESDLNAATQKHIRPGFWLLALILLACVAQGQGQLVGPGIVVDYPQGMKGSAERIVADFPHLKKACEVKIGYRYTRDVHVWVKRDHRGFNEQIVSLGGSKKPPFVAAVAFPFIDVIVLKSEAWTRHDWRQFKITFQHEIAHCLLGHLRRVYRGMDVPRWFDEGLAQWLSDGLYVGDDVSLHRALREGKWIPFEDLEKRFPRQEGASHLAYAQSESMVRFIAEFQDPLGEKANIKGLILRLVTGDSFDQALFAITGLHTHSMEDAWSRGEKSSFPFPLHLFPDAAFSLSIVVLCFLAYASYRIRRARRLDQMDTEELPAWGTDEDDPST